MNENVVNQVTIPVHEAHQLAEIAKESIKRRRVEKEAELLARQTRICSGRTKFNWRTLKREPIPVEVVLRERWAYAESLWFFDEDFDEPNCTREWDGFESICNDILLTNPINHTLTLSLETYSNLKWWTNLYKE